MKRGIQQKSLEIARQMLHKGFDRTLIQEFTHLSDEDRKIARLNQFRYTLT